MSVDATTINASVSGDNQVLLKFDSNGNLLWFKNINEIFSSENPISALTTDNLNNIIIGYDNFSDSHITKIHKLYVLPQIQSKGIGKKVIEYIKIIAIQNQNTSLILTVNRFNKAKDFYLKQGFQIIVEKQFDIDNGYIMDDYVMEFTI